MHSCEVWLSLATSSTEHVNSFTNLKVHLAANLLRLVLQEATQLRTR